MALVREQNGNSEQTENIAVGWHSETADAPPSPTATSFRRMVRTSSAASRAGGQGSELQQGIHPGDHYIRQVRPGAAAPLKEQSMVVKSDAEDIAPRSGVGRFFRLLIGNPLSTQQESHERLSKVQALAILSADALSAIAYATEQIVGTLAVAGVLAISAYSFNIALAITLLIFIVSFSYRQTIFAYPKGGGSYTVTKDNLGTKPRPCGRWCAAD